jgi:hypothetical protein
MIRQLLVSVALIATAQCQTSRGTVTGTVLDSSGASIQGTNITLTSQQTGIHLATVSNEAGDYRFDAVDHPQAGLVNSRAGLSNPDSADAEDETCLAKAKDMVTVQRCDEA